MKGGSLIRFGSVRLRSDFVHFGYESLVVARVTRMRMNENVAGHCRNGMQYEQYV